MNASVCCSSILLIATSVSAQTTWHVGALASGNDFDEIRDAFAAASHGDTIIVDINGGQPFLPATTNKGVRLLSTNGWLMRGAEVSVVGLPAGETFAMEGFGAPFKFTARDCMGSVHIEGIAGLWAPSISTAASRWDFVNCAHLTINSSAIWNVYMENCTALATDNLFGGVSELLDPSIGHPGLTMIDSDVTMGGGGIFGPRIWTTGPDPGVPALSMQGGRLRFAASRISDGIAGSEVVPQFPHPVTYSPAIISNGGVMVLDPDVYIGGVMQGDSVVTYEDMSYVRMPKVYPPAIYSLALWVHAPPSTSAVVAISLPGSPLPTYLGDLWLDPSPGGILPLGMGVTDATGTFYLEHPANSAWPPGVTPAVQAVLVDQAGIRLSMPVIGVMGIAY